LTNRNPFVPSAYPLPGAAQITMKLAILSIFSLIAAATAFAPASMQKASSAMHAEPVEQSRKAFLSAAAMSIFGAAIVGPAFAMDQENVSDPTEQWETGSPTASAEAARMARYSNARTQMTSNFPPIKRLTLERKSPVVSGRFYLI
jgi:hypothetical protein